jgi:hypothetical protein
LGPLNVFFFGLMLIGVPEAANLVAERSSRLLHFGAAIALSLGGLAIGWGVALLLLPDGVGVAVLGHLWYGANAVLIPMTLFMTCSGIQTGAAMVLRGLAAAQAGLRAAFAAAPFMLVFTVVGAVTLGVSGAAWGLASGRAVAAVLSWAALLRVAAKSPTRHGTGPDYSRQMANELSD